MRRQTLHIRDEESTLHVVIVVEAHPAGIGKERPCAPAIIGDVLHLGRWAGSLSDSDGHGFARRASVLGFAVAFRQIEIVHRQKVLAASMKSAATDLEGLRRRERDSQNYGTKSYICQALVTEPLNRE